MQGAIVDGTAPRIRRDGGSLQRFWIRGKEKDEDVHDTQFASWESDSGISPRGGTRGFWFDSPSGRAGRRFRFVDS